MADGMLDAFRKQVRMAASRYRLERFARASWPLAWALAVAFLVLLLLALMTPLVAWAWQIGAGLLLVALIGSVVIYSRGHDRHHLLIRMDAQAKLPDSVLSAGDWETIQDDPWRQRQRVETLRRLEQVNWRDVWPVRWPRLLWLPLASTVFLAGIMSLLQQNWHQREQLATLAQREVDKPVAADQIKPLEQVFKDWEEAQKIAPSPELAALLKQIKPLRDQMASGQMTEKQLLLKLNDVQASLQAAQDKLQTQSMDPMAASMAEAMKDLDGMSGLAAALQRKDYVSARDQAAQAQNKYQSGAAKMPEGTQAQVAADKMGEAAQKAEGNPQASSAMKQMQNSLSKQDSSGMSKGLDQLKDSLGQQAQKQAQGRNLGLQMAQLGDYKNGLGKSDSPGTQMGMPQLSLAKSLQQQKGAGTGVDPNRIGASTQLDANHQDVKLTGMAGNGASETQTESTQEPHFEKTAGSVDASQFAAYEKLSEQATQDENLPVADRQTIKRYFQDIRPQDNP